MQIQDLIPRPITGNNPKSASNSQVLKFDKKSALLAKVVLLQGISVLI